MGDLESVDGEYGDGGVDAEALEAGEEGVGPNEESDDVSEGGDADGDPGVPHGATKQLGQARPLTWCRLYKNNISNFDNTQKVK